MSEDFSAIEVLGIDEDNPVNRVHVGNMVYEISSTQVHSDLAIRGAFFEDPEKKEKNVRYRKFPNKSRSRL